MTLKEILEIIVPIVVYLIIFVYQKQKIQSLGVNIENQKKSIEAQTSAVGALKAQAEGQVALTERLETFFDKVQSNATTILTNYEKVVQLVEDRAAREKQEIEERAENEKQKSEALLEEARGQLATREEAIKEANMQPEIASLLTSLSQENFATKEMLTGLKTDLSQLISLTQSTLTNSKAHIADSFSNIPSHIDSKNDAPLNEFKSKNLDIESLQAFADILYPEKNRDSNALNNLLGRLKQVQGLNMEYIVNAFKTGSDYVEEVHQAINDNVPEPIKSLLRYNNSLEQQAYALELALLVGSDRYYLWKYKDIFGLPVASQELTAVNEARTRIGRKTGFFSEQPQIGWRGITSPGTAIID